MPAEDVIVAKLDGIAADVADLKQQLRALNGNVRRNCERLSILEATTLRWDAIKIGAIIGGVTVIMTAILKLAGVF